MDAQAAAAPFHAEAQSATMNSVWNTIQSMILSLIGAGILDKNQIKAEVKMLIDAAPLPVFFKPLLTFFAFGAIDSLLGAISAGQLALPNKP